MTSTLEFSSSLANFFLIPLVKLPEAPVDNTNLDWPEIQEDTVEIDLLGF